MIEIVTDKEFLKKPCTLSDDPYKTLDILKANFVKGKYRGLAAPQIGINDRVAVIWDYEVNVWIDIIDWRITAQLLPFVHQEACLSLPGMWYEVPRYRQIGYTDHDGQMWASYYGDEGETDDKKLNPNCIAVQHEMDHLNGILLEDIAVLSHKIIVPTNVSTSKIGRNDPCPCGSGKKYKKCCIDK